MLFNAANAEFVLWFHADSAEYADAEVGVASSRVVDGRYEFLGTFRPLGKQSRDMTVWQDEDGEF